MKIGKRNFTLTNFLFGSFLIKYGIRKIDREIDRDILIFRGYTKDVINSIMEKVGANSSMSNDDGLIAKLIK